jgi:hypothetical protein
MFSGLSGAGEPMSAIGKFGMGLQSIARALARTLSKLDGNNSSDPGSNSTFDMARVDDLIAKLKAEANQNRPAPAPPPIVQSFGKRRISGAFHTADSHRMPDRAQSACNKQ